MWRNPFRRRKPEGRQWSERDLALENAPWSPLSGAGDDEGDAAYAPLPPSQYPHYEHDRYSRGVRRFLPGFLRNRSWWWWISRMVASAIGVFIVLVAYLAITAPLSKSLEPIAPPQITLLAADGTPIARNGAMVDEPVEVAELPDHVIQPFLAIEDRRFYSHWGVDPRGVARAAFTGVGGGSTITQQLAKFTFLTPERSLTPQSARGADRILAGGLADEGRDPGTVSVQRLFWRQYVRPARRQPALFLSPS